MRDQYHPPGFAEWSRPEWVVISGGLERNAGAVDRTYTRYGATVYDTARAGAVTATIDRSGVQVQTFRKPAQRFSHHDPFPDSGIQPQRP